MTALASIDQSGLAAATLRLTVSATNLVNAGDSSTPGSNTGYKAKTVTQSSSANGGVVAKAVTLTPGQVLAFDPTSPVAGVQGLVEKPEIDPVSEITNQLAAGLAFRASLKALKAADEEEQATLDISA